MHIKLVAEEVAGQLEETHLLVVLVVELSQVEEMLRVLVLKMGITKMADLVLDMVRAEEVDILGVVVEEDGSMQVVAALLMWPS